ncbi:hypothetical protein LCGC14_1932430, partial [marine sediment metagenome]
YYNWSTDESWGADVCNLGTQCGSDATGTCPGGGGCMWATGANGYCGMVDWSDGGNLKGYYLITDTGTASPGTVLSSDSWDVNVLTQQTDVEESEMYQKSVMEGFLAGKFLQPSAYLTAYQSIAYAKGTGTYTDDYVGHKKVWDPAQSGVCTNTLCAVTSEWDDYSQMGSFSDGKFSDNKCSYSCGSKSAATLRTSLDNGFSAIVLMDGFSMELVVDGTSFGAGDQTEYDLVMMLYGYVGTPSVTDYLVYHPYNQKQEFTAADFNSWYKGFGCITSCDIDSVLNADDISVYAYDVVTLIPSGSYETGNAFEPYCGCWDYEFDGYENDFEDECRHATIGESHNCCDECPGVGAIYSGTEVADSSWDAVYTTQKNTSDTLDVAFTAIVYGIDSDRPVVFAEADITLQWIAPNIVADIQYAAGSYDNDANDDGNVVKTYTIGFNASGSTSDGPNNYTKIWGALWNITFRDSGVTDEKYCVSNYTDTGWEVVDPEAWCTSMGGGYTFVDAEWTRIINHTYAVATNFTAEVNLVTINEGPPSGIGWNGKKSINFSYVDSILIPGFDSVVQSGANVTDWNPPLTDPIIFNMNNTVFNEDYIEWIAVDYDNDFDTDRCYGRSIEQLSHCEHNSTFLDGSYTFIFYGNQSTSDNLELVSITITADGLGDINDKRNVSVKMATGLNVSGWFKTEYEFEAATLISDLRLIDSDTSTWDTSYGDTIFFDLNDTQFNRYNSSFININEVNISAVDCYDSILMKALCTVLGWLQLPDDFCYCVDETSSRRNWNHSPILGVCYDYT